MNSIGYGKYDLQFFITIVSESVCICQLMLLMMTEMRWKVQKKQEENKNRNHSATTICYLCSVHAEGDEGKHFYMYGLFVIRFVCLLLGDKHFYSVRVRKVYAQYIFKHKLSKTSVLSRKNEPFMFPFYENCVRCWYIYLCEREAGKDANRTMRFKRTINNNFMIV